MRRGLRPSLAIGAAALLVLIALLATLQYQWVGRVSDAERDRLRASLNARAAAFAQDFDRELTRAFLLFQVDPARADENVASRIAARYDRWQESARFPRMIKEVYFLPSVSDAGAAGLERYDPSTHFLEPVEWPPALARVRARLSEPAAPPSRGGGVVVRTLAATVWEDVPAITVAAPMLLIDQRNAQPNVHFLPAMSYTILLLDRGVLTGDVLPALARQHFGAVGAAPHEGTTVQVLKSWGDADYKVAVVRDSGGDVVYRSSADFSPAPGAPADATVDLFQVKPQEFVELASELRRYVAFTTTGRLRPPSKTIVGETFTARAGGSGHADPPLSILVDSSVKSSAAASIATSLAAAAARAAAAPPPHWRLVAKHPSGSLEAAVNAARRRNLLVSSSILAVLAISLGLLVLATRRAQALAQQQMEFVATVSHELRTPLAVIRSAADNLADGVIEDAAAIRRYGAVVRNEGRRLSELVEQILEYAGLQSEQGTRNRSAVDAVGVLCEVIADARPLASEAGLTIELAAAERGRGAPGFGEGERPRVLADEGALRRVFQNLIGNAIKYGVGGGRVAVRAAADESTLRIEVQDDGIGISAADQARIFEPFFRAPGVAAAQTPGAGLGLSLVRRIVEAHGGSVTVASAPGKGAIFTVALPVLPRDTRQRAGVAATAPQS